VSPLCASVRGRFDEYLKDTLESPARRGLREHLAACADCRLAAETTDPTLRFARPSRWTESAADVEGILSAVRTGVALMEAEGRIGGTRIRRRLAGTAAAAVLALLTLLLPGSSVARRSPAGTVEEPKLSAAATGLEPAALTREAESPHSNATVYDWNPGAGREEPRVVWIVDRGLDI